MIDEKIIKALNKLDTLPSFRIRRILKLKFQDKSEAIYREWKQKYMKPKFDVKNLTYCKPKIGELIGNYGVGEFADLVKTNINKLYYLDRTGEFKANRTKNNKKYYTNDQYLEFIDKYKKI